MGRYVRESMGLVSGSNSNTVLSADALMALAQDGVNAAKNYQLQLTNLGDDIIPPVVDADYGVTQDPPTLQTTDVPSFQEVAWVMPGLPTAFSADLNTDNLLPEPFDENPPQLVFGSAPAQLSATLPDAPDITTTFDDPTRSCSSCRSASSAA